MAKPKNLTKAQTDKGLLKLAKKLKDKGLLGKKVKLNQGRYISKATVKKVKALEQFAGAEFTSIKLDKRKAKEAKEKGLMIANGRLIAPKKSLAKFKERIKQNFTIGLRPLKRGYAEEVYLPIIGNPLSGNFDDYENHFLNNLDKMKEPNEVFIFSFFDNYQLTGKGFTRGAELYNYLSKYQSLFNLNPDQIAESLKIIRIEQDRIIDILPSQAERQALGDKRKKERGFIKRGRGEKSERQRERDAERKRIAYSKLEPEAKEAFIKKRKDAALKRYRDKKG